jgi:hypothetical protein
LSLFRYSLDPISLEVQCGDGARARLLVCALAFVAVHVVAVVPAVAQEPEPTTRAEVLERDREAKSQALTPPVMGRAERTLLALENTRFFERLLAPPEGYYPRIGQITSGSGFTVAPAYRRPRVFGEQGVITAFAALSYKKYWMLDAKLELPELADGRVFSDVHGRMFEFPSEQFYGIGPASLRGEEAVYGIRSSQVGAAGGVRPVSWLSLGTALDWLTPSVGSGDGGPSIDEVFEPSTIPGLEAQPDFLRWELSADINTRQPRGNPRRGGQYKALLLHVDDLDLQRYSFNRVDVDLQQYIPLLNERRVVALRAAASTSDVDAGQEVPFYLLRTLGGPDDLRGFRRFRFRDENSILLQAEYRWEIFTAVDGAIFYDAGKVASRYEDLNLKDLESDYGIGFRFGTRNGVFLRVEGAFGSSGGKHFILRFGNVF